jgi:integrase
MAKHRTGHLLRRGSNFYCRWTIDGKVFSKSLRDESGNPITSKREAEEARAKLMAPFLVADETAALESIVGKLQGRKAELARLEDETNPPLTIAHAWSEYLKASNRPDTGPDTLAVYEGQFGRFERWMTEQHPNRLALREVTSELAEDYASHLSQTKMNPNTFNKHVRVLELVFRVLKKKAKMIGDNPWEHIQRKKLRTNSRRELTIEELRNVCQKAGGELRILFALGIYSGLRLKDCATLRWAEVDMVRKLIRRVPSKTARRSPRPVIVPIHPILLNMLADRPRAKGEYVLPDSAAKYLDHKRDLIRQIQDHFTACSIKVHRSGTGNEDRRAIVDVGFHSLRHTFVSLCRESNAPLAVVQSIVGHSNPAMTQHYTHVGELAAGQAVALLPSVMGKATKEPKTEDPAAVLRKAKAIAEKITAKNWEKKTAALLALLNRQTTVKEAN